MNDLMQLTAAHNTAALRFAFIASLEAERENGERHNPTQVEVAAYDAASAAEREALQAVIEHVPVSSYDLNIKARYLLARIALGEPFPHEQTEALLRSIVRFVT